MSDAAVSKNRKKTFPRHDKPMVVESVTRIVKASERDNGEDFPRWRRTQISLPRVRWLEREWSDK
jgi:hypothetical protein